MDGTVLAAGDATVAALDHGVSVGDGVFETLKVVEGTPFAFRRHLARLHRSLAVLDLPVPMTDDAFRHAATGVIARLTGTGTTPGRLRITVTAGPGPLGSSRAAAAPTVIIAAAPS